MKNSSKTSFLSFHTQRAVDLIHINVLLSSIPYLPIPTNLITISLTLILFQAPELQWQTYIVDLYRILCLWMVQSTMVVVAAVTNLLIVFLNRNKLNMVVRDC